MVEKAILYDATRCTACRGCQAACKQWNENDEGDPELTACRGSYENPDDLSTRTWLKIEFREVETAGKLKWLFTRRSCMHCTDAACVKVCPNGSLYHDENGMVVLNRATCTGCAYCVDFCPFQIPRVSRNAITSQGTASKCVSCMSPGLDRISGGLEPACVKTCPTGALRYGDRANLVAAGKKSVEDLKAKGRPNAYLYGEKELGGLHVMYVLEESPGLYGLPVNPQMPVLTSVWQDILQPVGLAVGALTVVGLGVNFVVARKTKLEKELAELEERK